MIADDALNIFVDGSSYAGPRRGGVGMVFVAVNAEGVVFFEDTQSPPGYQGASNNQMELLACVLALKEGLKMAALKTVSKIVIHSDSRYVTENYPRARYWQRNGWHNRHDRPVEHPAIWKDLLKLVAKSPLRVKIQWVEGHSAKNPYNKIADRLAKASAKNALNRPINVTAVAKKLSKQSTRRGCIPVQGQRLIIRIIMSQYMKLQRKHKYKYEVMSHDSPDYGLVDIIYSNARIFLRRNHKYDVTLNSDQAFPQIVEVHAVVDA